MAWYPNRTGSVVHGGPVDKKKLLALCQKFVKENAISCGETIYQCDWVIEHAYEFIDDVCQVVGWFREDGVEDD